MTLAPSPPAAVTLPLPTVAAVLSMLRPSLPAGVVTESAVVFPPAASPDVLAPRTALINTAG